MNTVCKIADCGSTNIQAKKMCVKHYKRWYRNGDPSVIKCAPNGDRKQHPLYSTYTNMKTRCFNKHSFAYKDYGARGITVCDRWLGVDGFENFCKDMGERKENNSLERVDNNKSYSPDNCIWATKFQQAHNRRLRSENRSGVAGVFESKDGRWQAYITRFKKRHNLGSYTNFVDAVRARQHGEEVYS